MVILIDKVRKSKGDNISSESSNEVTEDSKQSAIDFDTTLWDIVTRSEASQNDKVRKSKGLTYRRLSELSGIPKSTLRDLEIKLCHWSF